MSFGKCVSLRDIVPQPGEAAPPGLKRLWEELTGGTLIKCDSRRPGPANSYTRPHKHVRMESNSGVAAAGAAGLTRTESSQNWSGASLAASGGQYFHSIWGKWTIPRIEARRVRDISYPEAKNRELRYSAWIGLDGSRQYSRSLPQVGTTHIFRTDENGRLELTADKEYVEQTCHLWHQWWVRGRGTPRTEAEAGLATLNHFELRPGDTILCALVVTSAGRVRVSARNGDQTVSVERGPFLDDYVPVEPITVEGASAEWIVERPTKIGSDELYDPIDFGDFAFSDCWAETASAASGPGESARGLSGSRLIRMTKTFDSPHRSQFIAVPERKPYPSPANGEERYRYENGFNIKSRLQA